MQTYCNVIGRGLLIGQIGRRGRLTLIVFNVIGVLRPLRVERYGAARGSCELRYRRSVRIGRAAAVRLCVPAREMIAGLGEAVRRESQRLIPCACYRCC